MRKPPGGRLLRKKRLRKKRMVYRHKDVMRLISLLNELSKIHDKRFGLRDLCEGLKKETNNGI